MHYNQPRDETASGRLLNTSQIYGTISEDEIRIHQRTTLNFQRRKWKPSSVLLFVLIFCGISAVTWYSLRKPTTSATYQEKPVISTHLEYLGPDNFNVPAKNMATSDSSSQTSGYFEPNEEQHAEPKPISPKEKKEKNDSDDNRDSTTASTGEGKKPKSISISPGPKSTTPSKSPKPKSRDSKEQPSKDHPDSRPETSKPKSSDPKSQSTTEKPPSTDPKSQSSTQKPKVSTQRPKSERNPDPNTHQSSSSKRHQQAGISPTSSPNAQKSTHSKHKHKSKTHGTNSTMDSSLPSPTVIPISSPTQSPSAKPVAAPSFSPNGNSIAEDGFNTRPHIILVLVDDMGFNDISYNNDPQLVNQVETPFLKQLARSGIILEKFYAFADCTPSRAALLTSVHPLTSGMYMDTINYDSEWGLPLRYKILPQHLKLANYTSHIVGKWDIGHYTRMLTPIERGFDSFLGYYGSSVDYFSHEVTQTQYCETTACKHWLNKCDGSVFTDFHWNKEYLQTLNYSTAVYEHRVETILDEYAEKGHTDPLFLYVAHQAPHSPHQASNETNEYFQSQFLVGETGWKRRATFAACLYELDTAIQSMVERMQSLDLYSRSYIFFMSDNGAVPGKLGGGSNWPLRGGKFLPYEGGVRVPAFVHSPMLPRKRWGSTYSSLVHITDILPTVLDLAGISNIEGTIDGISFLQSLFSGAEGSRVQVLVHADVADKNDRTQWFGAYIHRDWKIVINGTDAGWYSPDSLEYATTEMGYTKPEVYTDRAARHGDYSSYFNTSALYDLKTDPSERTNLIETYPEIFEKLRGKFVEYVAQAADAEYDCGCNCQSDGCAYLYEWFYHHSCFVYPWSSNSKTATPSPEKPAVPAGLTIDGDDDNPSQTPGSRSKSSSLPDLIAIDRIMHHAPVHARS